MTSEDQKTMVEAVAELERRKAIVEQLTERVAYLQKQNEQLIAALSTTRVMVNVEDIKKGMERTTPLGTPTEL